MRLKWPPLYIRSEVCIWHLADNPADPHLFAIGLTMDIGRH